MAEYKLRADAADWFKHIIGEPPFKTKFDLYYLCLLLGLAGRRRSSPIEKSPPKMQLKTMVEDYRSQELLITALLLHTEMRSLGLDYDDREEVGKVLGELVGKAGLSNEGISKLNRYASGGFDLLLERYGELKPYKAEEFLPRYAKLLDEVIGEEAAWN